MTKICGRSPNDDALIKLLWLAICNIEDKRARDRARDTRASSVEWDLGRGSLFA